MLSTSGDMDDHPSLSEAIETMAMASTKDQGFNLKKRPNNFPDQPLDPAIYEGKPLATLFAKNSRLWNIHQMISNA